MKLSIKYRNIDYQFCPNLDMVVHSIAVPLFKGVWYFEIQFKTKVHIDCYDNDDEYDEQVCFTVNNSNYVIVKFDASKEKIHLNVFGHLRIDHYYGIAIDINLIDKAWNKHAGKKRK